MSRPRRAPPSSLGCARSAPLRPAKPDRARPAAPPHGGRTPPDGGAAQPRGGHGHLAAGRAAERPAAVMLCGAGGRAEPQPDGAAGAADGAGAGGHPALRAGAARRRARPVPHRGRAGPVEGEPHRLPAALPLQRAAARRLPPVSGERVPGPGRARRERGGHRWERSARGAPRGRCWRRAVRAAGSG